MPFTQPGEWGLGATAGTITTLPVTAQPIRVEPIISPRRGRRDNGVVQHGRDGEIWVIAEGDVFISIADFQTLMGYWNTAKANANRIFARTYDPEASAGAGAWSNYRFVMERPRGEQTWSGEVVGNVAIVLRARGIP